MSIRELISQFGEKYLAALVTTYKLTLSAFLLTVVLGVVITVFRLSPIRPLRVFADFYVQIFRNIPGAALLILLVYALPYLNVVLSYYAAVLIATALIPSAFCSEYLMSGVNAVAVGEIEAARSLGMTFFQTIKTVVLPQAVRSSVLPMTHLLASQVPLNPTDLTGIVSYINTHAVGGVTAFAISAALYCATAVIIGRVGNRIDRKVRILR